MSFSNPKTTVIILKEPSDWDEWTLIINSMARRGYVENFVDLTAIETPEPTKPTIPTYSDVKVGAISLAGLSDDQKRELLMLRDDHKEALKDYREKRTAPKEIDHHILTTGDSRFVMLLKGKPTVHRKFLVLKERLASIVRIRKLEVNR